jgi:hypothetical protein
MAIELRSGTIVDDEIIINDGELDRIYRPALLSRTRKDEIADALEALRSQFEKNARLARRRAATREEKRRVADETIRRYCDAISLAIEGSAESTPRAGDLLYDGYINDRVSDDQIEGLFGDLFVADVNAEGDSPS